MASLNMKMQRLFFVLVVVLCLFLDIVQCEESEVQNNEEGRTFGHHFLKRMSFAMIPMMYKLGMMTTLLITLTVMSTKGLAVGILLLVLAISQMISRSGASSPAVYPYVAQPQQPAVVPVVYHAQPTLKEVPLVHKAIVHAPYAAYSAYGAQHGWQDRSGSAVTAAYSNSPYAREETEEVQYEDKRV